MEVAYTTTLDDYVVYCRYLFWKSPSARHMYSLGWAALPASCMVVAVVCALYERMDLAAIAAGVGVVCILIYPLVQRAWLDFWVRSYAKRMGTRGVIGPIRLVLGEETLVEITELTRTEARWKDMRSVEEFGDHTFIMVTGLSAAILPRRGFESDPDYFRVRDFARARVGRGAEPGSATGSGAGSPS